MTSPWVVTGTGLVTARGDTREDLWAALVSGQPILETDPAGFPAAEMRGFDARTYLPRKGVKDLSRASQLACSSAARIAPGLESVATDRVGVVYGSAWGSLRTVVEFEREAFLEGPRFVDPIRFTETVANVPAGQVSIFFGWSAFNATVSAGSASGLAALLQALDFLEEGRGRVAVAGGGDDVNGPVLRTLRAEGSVAVSPGSLPFAQGRSGPVVGEGACVLALESEDHARGRGAVPAGRIRAAASRFAPDGASGDSAERLLGDLLRHVLEEARLAPAFVDLLVLHANGSPAGDALEARAIRTVFGRGPAAPPVLAPKAVLGETWGASGPLAVVAACEAMRTGTVPGPPRELVLDPDLEGLHFPRGTLRKRVQNVLVLDGSTTGHAIALVVCAPGEPA